MTGSATLLKNEPLPGVAPSVILSFDVEEHHRIEAAVGLDVPAAIRAAYGQRMETVTRRLLDCLASVKALATFYLVGEIAGSHPRLVKDIAAAGHEVGGHSWDHRRVHRFDPHGFAEDLRISKDRLEQAGGCKVFGFRAPTFSITRDTAWALDVLAESGYVYDSSIYPVRHDRYGIPEAPRGPFLAVGPRGGTMLELPPVTYRLLGQNLPAAGGGYFRLLPLWMTRRAVRQMLARTPPVAMMYFHPWEFDPDQPRMTLKTLSSFRTYVGMSSCEAKLQSILNGLTFRRAIDVVDDLNAVRGSLPRFEIGTTSQVLSARVSVTEAAKA